MRKYKLRELLTIKNGCDYRHLSTGSVPVYGSGGFMCFVNQAMSNKPSILLPRKGTLNNIMFIDKPFWTVDTMYWSEIKEDIVEPYYLYNYLKVLKFDGIRTGSTLPSMTSSAYYDIPVILPDYNKQTRVANILKLLNNKIELNNKINQELEQMAKTLYEYWFVQFDFPDEKGRPYKSANGKMVYNEVLKREIPDGWEVGTFSSYIHQDKGGDWGKDTQVGNYTKKVTCIRGADFPSLHGYSCCNAPIRYILNKNSSKILSTGDLVVEISGGSPAQSTGRIGYVNQHTLARFDNDIITSNFCKALSLNNKNALYNFYLEWERLYKSGVFFNYEGKTTGIKNLLFDTFVESYKIVIPPQNIVDTFYANVSNMFEKIQCNAKENHYLELIRDFLLPLLMNGQVTVRPER